VVLPVAERRLAFEKALKAGAEIGDVIPYFAKEPQPADRELFARGLQSVRPATLVASAEGLAALGGTTDEHLVSMLRGIKTLNAKDPALPRLIQALVKVTGTNAGADAAAWERWAAAKPELAKKLHTPGIAEALARIEKLDFSKGDTVRGLTVFRKAQCAACHNAEAAVGPSLAGITGRFGKNDLIRATVDPDRDVPNRYRMNEYELTDGSSVRGTVIYEAIDGVILQTTAADTIRIDGGKIAQRRELSKSLMPAGLLDPLSDAEIIDLFAYLATLGAKK
jgi:putative heme-binding domain-containing protein